jgi:hypothetical protein
VNSPCQDVIAMKAAAMPAPDPLASYASRTASTLAKASPGLRIRAIERRARRLRVGGTLAAGATSRVTVTWRARLGGRWIARRTRVAAGSGRFAARLRLPREHRSARRVWLRVRYSGDALHREQLIVKRLARGRLDHPAERVRVRSRGVPR